MKFTNTKVRFAFDFVRTCARILPDAATASFSSRISSVVAAFVRCNDATVSFSCAWSAFCAASASSSFRSTWSMVTRLARRSSRVSVCTHVIMTNHNKNKQIYDPIKSVLTIAHTRQANIESSPITTPTNQAKKIQYNHYYP